MITEDDIRQVVTHFYGRVRADEMLSPIFAGRIDPETWPSHEAHIVDFWSSIFLKSGRFKGNPMMKHQGLAGIKPAHFSRWIKLFSEVASEQLPPEKADQMIEMAERIGQSLQMGLAFHYEKSGLTAHPFTQYGVVNRATNLRSKS